MGNRIAWLVLSVLVITFAIIGCGGGGGSETANPVGPAVLSASTADLSGTVMFDEKPLPEANVFLYRSDKAVQAGVSGLSSLRGSILAQANLADGSYSTKTDQTGRYNFTSIPVGEYTLIAVKDEVHQFAQTGVLLGSVTTADAKLTPTGKVTGNIQLSASQPVPGAIVYLEKTSYVAISDANGDFVINHVPAGTSFSLQVLSDKGTLLSPQSVLLTPAQELALGPVSLVAPSQQVTAINGSIIASGSLSAGALAGRIVLLTSADPYPMVTLSDASGKFSLSVKKTGNYTVNVVGGEFNVTPSQQTVNVIALGTTVTLAQSFVVEKPVVNFPQFTQYFAVSGSIAKRTKAFGEADEAGVPLILTSLNGLKEVYSAVSSPVGSFTFSVPTGSYTLAVGGGYAFETTFTGNPIIVANANFFVPQTIWLAPTQTAAPLFVVSGVASKTAFINGETDNGNLVMSLTSTAGVASVYTGTTDAAGNFAIRVPAGSYNFAVLGSNYKFTAPFTGNPVNVTTTNVSIPSPVSMSPAQPLAPLFVVSGLASKTAFIDGETDNSNLVISLTSVSGVANTYTGTTDAAGNFAIRVPAGIYNFALLGSNYKFTTPFTGNPVNVTTANVSIPSPVTMSPTEAAKISGTVSPLSQGDFMVKLREKFGTYTDYETAPSETGSFAFYDVPAGIYNLAVLPTGNGYYLEFAEFSVSDGEVLSGLASTAIFIAPQISSHIVPVTDVLHITGSNFLSLPNIPAETVVKVDGNVLPRIAAFPLTDFDDEVSVSTVAPGEHNVVLEKKWTRPATSEVYYLSSKPHAFYKNLASPTVPVVEALTDKTARITWTNAPFAQKTEIEVWQGGVQVGATAIVDGNTYEITGLTANTTYDLIIENIFGDIHSAAVNMSFNTKQPGVASPSSITLQGTSSLVSLLSPAVASGAEIFGFELMNDKIYIAYLEPLANNLAVVKSFDLNGNALNTFSVSVWTQNPAMYSLDRYDLCVGNNSVYLTYEANITTVQNIQMLSENLSAVGSPVQFGVLGISGEDKAKIEYHGSKLFVSCNDSNAPRGLYVYAVNADLSGAAQVYTSTNTLPPSSGYWLQTAADEKTDDLYIAVAGGASVSIDNFQIIKKSLIVPTLPGANLANVSIFGTMISEFGVNGSNLVINGDSSTDFYTITRNFGFVNTLIGSDTLSNFGVDSKNRLWTFSGGDQKALVNLEEDHVVNSFAIQGYPSDNAPYIKQREFIKLQTIGTPGRFGMLYVNQTNELAVLGYDSSF